MIINRLKKVFDEFMSNYEEISITPYHVISKEDFYYYYEEYINNNDVTNKYEFNYFMSHMIKILNGKIDAHTKYFAMTKRFPINFRIIDDEILVNYPEEEKGNKLISINDIPLQTIIDEIDFIISYGTEGKKKWELEQAFFQKELMLSLPSLRESKELVYKFIDLNNNEYTKTFDMSIEEYDGLWDRDTFLDGDPGAHNIKDNCLIIEHSSIQKEYEEQIKQRYEELSNMDLSNIDRIIVDIRINGGGNSRINNYLYEFLDKHKDKELITLTGYRVFSGGRYALLDLKNRGSLMIGEEISTPLNCRGNSKRIVIKDELNNERLFAIAYSYLDPYNDKGADNKEAFKEKFTYEDVENLNIYKPDIFVTQSKEDFINGIDTILEYAINYKKIKTHQSR